MTQEWKCPKKFPPPQGRKILYFNKGDTFVAQRFGKKYIAIYPKNPGAGGVLLDAPEFWSLIDMPDGYHGFILVKMPETYDQITVDEMEKSYPKE